MHFIGSAIAVKRVDISIGYSLIFTEMISPYYSLYFEPRRTTIAIDSRNVDLHLIGNSAELAVAYKRVCYSST